jgi:hypothetical protein|tara:strand:- start:869 stop:1021 length:153 start_codon:yes stop_codon:yes gene_type:complete
LRFCFALFLIFFSWNFQAANIEFHSYINNKIKGHLFDKKKAQYFSNIKAE